MNISGLKLPRHIPFCFNNEDSSSLVLVHSLKKQIDPQMWNLDGDRGGGGGKNTVKGFVPTLLPPL